MKKDAMWLQGTPFVCLHRDIPFQPFAIGRADTREMLCIGSFNAQFAEGYDANEYVYLKLKLSGEATDLMLANSEKDDPSKHVKIDGDTAVVCCKIDCYWIAPFGFDEWKTKAQWTWPDPDDKAAADEKAAAEL